MEESSHGPERDPRAEPGISGGLLSDPPLLDRLTWREGIQPQTLISRDRGLIARTFGTLYMVGGLVGILTLVVGEENRGDEAAIAALTAGGIALGIVCFVGYRRLPLGFFAALVTLGTLMIAAGALTAPDGAQGVYGFYFVWIVFASFLFFSPRAATLQSLFAAVAYALTLFGQDAEFAGTLLISAIATIGTTGAIMGLLMTRIESIATGFAVDAHTDPVTAIANRRAFDQRFARAVERARRSGRPLSIVICDLDRFKEVNDALGHEEGDLALRRAAEAIAASVRSMDAVARLGGEEFGVILPDADRRTAMRIADRVRDAISSEFESYPVHLTASCGVASTHDAEDEEALFRAADSALYVAKRAGRDRSAAHGDDGPIAEREPA
jgi:diguanylate cyclase (GGDEF)-like protein